MTSPEKQSENQKQQRVENSKCSDQKYEDFQKEFEKTIKNGGFDVNEYIQNRVNKKIIFFDCLKNREKYHHRVFQFSIIIIGATITVINSILPNESYASILRPLTAILGASIIIFTSIIHFNKYQEKMLSFKITLRTLEKELYLFLQGTGEYSKIIEGKENVEDKESIFVQRIESVLEKEALDYIAIFSSDKPANRNK